MHKILQAAAILAALSVVGCIPVRPITQTNKASDYTTQPRNVVFVPAIGGSLPNDQIDLFKTVFAASLQSCGLKVATLPVASTPNTFAITAAIRDSGNAGGKADSVLVVQTAQTGRDNAGQNDVGYALSLDDLVSKKTVWKAIIKTHWDPLLSQHDALGRDVAAAAVAAMRKDNLIPEGCAPAP
jgi:hypothetical protein